MPGLSRSDKSNRIRQIEGQAGRTSASASHMELELRIIRDPYAELPKQRVRVFGENGGDIGRAPDCYWLLPDPKCYLSGRHCTILFRDGAFWVRDTSRNGVFMNGSEEPLGFGHKAKLAHGHELKFATYKVLVRIKSRGRQPADSVAGDFNPGSTVEPEEQFADVFAATPVAEPLDTPPREPVLEHEKQNLEASSQTMDAVTPQDSPASNELAGSSSSVFSRFTLSCDLWMKPSALSP